MTKTHSNYDRSSHVKRLRRQFLLGPLCFVMATTAVSIQVEGWLQQQQQKHFLSWSQCPISRHTFPYYYIVHKSRFLLKADGSSEQKKPRTTLEDDISKRLSISKDWAISALSQPVETKVDDNSDARIKNNQRRRRRRKNSTSKSDLPTSEPKEVVNQVTQSPTQLNKKGQPSNKSKTQKEKSIEGIQKGKDASKPVQSTSIGLGSKNEQLLGTSFKPVGSASSKSRRSKPKVSSTGSAAYSSLLPPPLIDAMLATSTFNEDDDTADSDMNENSFASGLSTWEQFLDAGASASDDSANNWQSRRKTFNDSELTGFETGDNFTPSPPQDPQRLPSVRDLFPSRLSSSDTDAGESVRSNQKAFWASSASTPASPASNSYIPPKKLSALDGVMPVSELFYRSSQAEVETADNDHDDEELPFSAEQSDAVSSDQNKVMVRQNLAKPQALEQRNQFDRLSPPRANEQQTTGVSSSKPNLYSIENKNINEKNRKMTRRGMEMLVGGIPINADPPQRSVQLMYEPQPLTGVKSDSWSSVISLNTRAFGPLLHVGSTAKVTDFEKGLYCENFCRSAIKWDICPDELHQIVKVHRKDPNSSKVTPLPGKVRQNAVSNDIRTADTNSPQQESVSDLASTKRSERSFEMNGECSFEIGVTREELESGENGIDDSVFRTVCTRALTNILHRSLHVISDDNIAEDFSVDIPQLTLVETDDGYTSISLLFQINAGFTRSYDNMKEKVKEMEKVFIKAMDDGEIALAIASAAKEETRWSEAVRNRVVEECLFPDDDVEELSELQWKRSDGMLLINSKETDAFQSERLLLYPEGSSGFSHGVYHDYSASNVQNSPYFGEIGLRLVDAATERAKQRHPKVIAIGDVHGCIDELQDLLRQCDYSPGDLVIFLGDLVCKGPDSISVVQMAREIGAIGVRGNHDFEVVRWHHAMKSGVDPPVFSSEHFHIASCLSKADMNWMYSLPWYISSKDLGALFVHAGFVSGIRLAKQNPRLMMNMRSVLPDGTVTSKFFNNWPWARLWDGPQTVLFGHDADRGLQQYEHAIGLDTGCVYGGRLTACILPEKRLVSVSARREYFKYRRKHYD